MSFRDATRPQDLGPDRLKPAQGTPILDASVEAEGWATDLCTEQVPRDVVRGRLLAWLAEGVREVTWVLCSLPRDRWAATPPARLGDWPVLRHVRHIGLSQTLQLLPAVSQATGESNTLPLSTIELEQADAAWDPALAVESAEAIVQNLATTRFELLQRLEAASDEVWDRPLQALASDSPTADPVRLDWLLLSARQHELQHLTATWKIALNWDRVSLDKAPIPGVPLHPADRLEESH